MDTSIIDKNNQKADKPVQGLSKYKISELAERITPENAPGKIDIGPPVGKELA